MSDILVLGSATVNCQDGVTREDCSLVVRDAQYVFLDADGVALEGDQAVLELTDSICSIGLERFTMITAQHGPILS